ARITLAVELTTIPQVNEEFDGTAESLKATGKTAGATGQASQVVTEFGVVALNPISFTLVGDGGVKTRAVEDLGVGSKQVAKVKGRLTSLINHRLQRFLAAFFIHRPSEKATGCPIHQRHDVDPLFFFPTKVNSSSNSALFTSPGLGASGSWSV